LTRPVAGSAWRERLFDHPGCQLIQEHRAGIRTLDFASGLVKIPPQTKVIGGFGQPRFRKSENETPFRAR